MRKSQHWEIKENVGPCRLSYNIFVIATDESPESLNIITFSPDGTETNNVILGTEGIKVLRDFLNEFPL